MDTPVLTKKQQRQSLSAKKGPIKGLRNVLAQPQDTYWPVVGQMDGEKINSVLRQLLPSLRRPLQKERKKKMVGKCTELKEELIKIKEPLPNKDLLDSVVLGINAVTRSLEKNQLCCILLDADVEPPLLIKHIIMMAQIKKKEILLLPSLKNLTFESIGFACAALALKNEVLSLDHHFYTLYENISCIYKDYSQKQAVQLFISDTSSDGTILQDSKMDNKFKESTSSTKKEFISFQNVYKFRSSCKERTFIPPIATVNLVNIQKEADFISLDNNFISLDNDMNVSDNEDVSTNEVVEHTRKSRYFKPSLKKDSESCNLQNKRNNSLDNNSMSGGIFGNLTMETKKKRNFRENNVTYLPLKIKRLRGNSNRMKATKVSKKKKKNQRK